MRYAYPLLLAIILLAPARGFAKDSLGVTRLGELSYDWDEARDIAVQGNHAYVADNGAGLRVVDISDPAHPVQTGYFVTPGPAEMVTVAGGLAFVSGSSIGGDSVTSNGSRYYRNGIYVVNVENPAAPHSLGFWRTPYNVTALAADSENVYVALQHSGPTINELEVMNLDDPAHPDTIAHVNFGSNINEMRLVGTQLYVGTARELDIYSVADPANPSIVAGVNTGSAVYFIAVAGEKIYVITNNGNLIVLTLVENNLVELGRTLLTSESAISLSAWDNFVLMGSRNWYGSEYHNWATVYDVSDPQNITQESYLPTNTPIYQSVILDGIGYLASGVGGLETYDLHDPAHPTAQGQYVDPGFAANLALAGNVAFLANGVGGWCSIDISHPEQPSEFAFISGRQVTDLVISDNHIFAAGDLFQVFNVANPSEPTIITEWDLDRGQQALTIQNNIVAQTSGGTTLLDVSAVERPAAIGSLQSNGVRAALADTLLVSAAGTYGVSVWDIHHPALAERLSYYETDWSPLDVAVRDTLAYLACSHHNGAGGALQIVTLANPWRMDEVSFLAMPAPARGIALSGHFAFVADGDSGLRIVDIRDPVSPVETGHYDTPGCAVAIKVAGRFAYVADSTFFGIYDCGDAIGFEGRSLRSIVAMPDGSISAYPNPFNTSTTLTFGLNSNGPVKLRAYDALGRMILDLTPNFPIQPGKQSVRLEGSNLPAGQYFVRLEAGGRVAQQSLTLLK